ncbi:MAG: FG-GAP-like repeat-containing protein, partial [Bacteroidota bacterium]
SGSIEFADVDQDFDEDLILTGETDAGFIAKLYMNDGNGNFTERTEVPFEGVVNSYVAFGDVNGDDNLDVLISGLNEQEELITKLYLNDGQGFFTESVEESFSGVKQGSIDFADIDNDGDKDLLLSGDGLSPITELYVNDGKGKFTEIPNTPFLDVYLSSSAFADIDNDGDQDVLISGWDVTGFPISELYLNDGTGEFTEDKSAQISPAGSSSIEFEDFDSDGDVDLVLSGRSPSLVPFTELYINNGSGDFSLREGGSISGISAGEISSADIDNDGDKDLLITGQSTGIGGLTELYTNDGSGNFTELISSSFLGVSFSSAAFSDIDLDGDQDLIIMGLPEEAPFFSTEVYINQGSSTSLGDVHTGFDVNLFPNPSSGTINLAIATTFKAELTVEMLDIQGKLLSQNILELGPSTQIKIEIPTHSLSNGLYLLRLVEDNRLVSLHRVNIAK